MSNNKSSFIHEISNEDIRCRANQDILRSILVHIEGIKWQESLDFMYCDHRYLLNQTIRQYKVPFSQLHISAEAKRYIDNYLDVDLRFMHETTSICVKSDFSVYTYGGVSSCSLENKHYKAGDSFKANDVFMYEHIVPVHDIMETLINKVYSANASDEENMQEFARILDKIHTAWILKHENKSLKRCNRVSEDDIMQLSASQLYKKAMNSTNYPKLSQYKRSCKIDGVDCESMGECFNVFVKKLVADHPDYSFEYLDNFFAYSFGYSTSCINKRIISKEAYDFLVDSKSIKNRYNINNPIIANGVEFYTSYKWQAKHIQNGFYDVIDLAKHFGYSITID